MSTPTVNLHLTDDHRTNIADITVPVPLASPEPGYMSMFDAGRFEQLVKQAADAFARVFEDAQS
jgi:hypothetical protein